MTGRVKQQKYLFSEIRRDIGDFQTGYFLPRTGKKDTKLVTSRNAGALLTVKVPWRMKTIRSFSAVFIG